jgi:hypothetical protein
MNQMNHPLQEIQRHWFNTMKQQGKNPLRMALKSPLMWYKVYMTPSPHLDRYFEYADRHETLTYLKQRLTHLKQQEQCIKDEVRSITNQIEQIGLLNQEYETTTNQN